MHIPPDDDIFVVAVCIFKNEAENIPALFASVEGFVDAWVVVDTGSTDDTLGACRRAGVEHGVAVDTSEDAWDDDFARSRNFSLDRADATVDYWQKHSEFVPMAPNGDRRTVWYIYIDGDDRLEHAPEIRTWLASIPNGPVDPRWGIANKIDAGFEQPVSKKFLEHLPFAGLRVDSPTFDGRLEVGGQFRLLRADAGIRFIYPVHAAPDVAPWAFGDDRGVGMSMPPVGRILHIGYQSKAEIDNNVERTLRILRTRMEPDDPRRIYKEARALGWIKDWDGVLACCKYIDTLTPENRRKLPSAVWHIAALAVLNKHGDYRRAVDLLNRAIQGEPDVPEYWTLLHGCLVAGLYDAVKGVATGTSASASSGAPAGFRMLRSFSAMGVTPMPLATIDQLGKLLERTQGATEAPQATPTAPEPPAAPQAALNFGDAPQAASAHPEAVTVSAMRRPLLAIIGAYKRPIDDTVAAILGQSYRPDKLVIWVNGIGGQPGEQAGVVHEVGASIGRAEDLCNAAGVPCVIITSTDNLYHAARYAAALLVPVDGHTPQATDIIAVFDDDVVPGPRWLEAAHNAFEDWPDHEHRIVGGVARNVAGDGTQVAVPAQRNADIAVSFVGQATLMDRRTAALVFRAAPIDARNGWDDIHLCGEIHRHNGLSILVRQDPERGDVCNTQPMRGADDVATYLTRPEHSPLRAALVRRWFPSTD